MTRSTNDVISAVIDLFHSKGIDTLDDLIIVEVGRFDPKRYTTLLRYLARADTNLLAPDAETPVAVQTFFARLRRHGIVDVGLPTCPMCQQKRIIRFRDQQRRRVCLKCHERQHYGECPVCERMKKLTAETDQQGRRICARCSPGGIRLVACSTCSKEVAATTKVDGLPVCLGCYPRPLRMCSACGKEKKIATHIRSAPHCFACHNRVVRKPQPCPKCGVLRILAFVNGDHIPICAGCAGQPARYACRRCGSEEHFYGRLCGKCTLSDRLTAVLTRPDTNAISDPMQLLVEHLLRQPRPEQIIKWLRMGPHTDLLHDIATGAKPLNEKTLATAHGGKGLIYLQTLLAESGALPHQESELVRLRSWCDRQITALPQSDRIVLTQYVQWELLRRPKRNETTGDVAAGAARHVKAAIRGIGRLLAWLHDDEQIPLHRITQEQVDRYALRVETGRWLPRFTKWAITNGHIANDVTSPPLHRTEPAVTLAEDRMESVVQSLLSDTTLRAGVKLAVLLVAIYGLPARRVVEFKREQLTATSGDDTFALSLRGHQLALPDAVSTIAKTHLREVNEVDSAWLFPGHYRQRPMSDQQLRRTLDPYDVTLNQLQTAARYRLAGAIPTKILADSLDFHINTVAKYASLSNGRWADYPSMHT